MPIIANNKENDLKISLFIHVSFMYRHFIEFITIIIAQEFYYSVNMVHDQLFISDYYLIFFNNRILLPLFSFLDIAAPEILKDSENKLIATKSLKCIISYNIVKNTLIYIKSLLRMIVD